MTNTDLTTLGSSAQEFLTKNEKAVGYLGIGFLGLFGAGLLYMFRGVITGFLGFAITTVGQLMVLGGLGLLAVFILTLLMQPAVHTEIRHLQYRIIRAISDLAMKADPFGRMRAFANEYLQEQWMKFNNAAVRIQDQLNQKNKKIEKYQADLNSANDNVKALPSRHMKNGQWDTEDNHNLFRSESMKIKFLEGSLEKLRKDQTKLSMLVKIVDKWRNSFKFEIETTRMTADFLEEDFRQADATAGALEAASSAFGGGDMARADKEVRQYIENLTSGRIARAEVLMKQIPELTALGDLKADVAEDDIMNRLRQLDSAADQAFVEVQDNRQKLTSGNHDQIVEVIKAPVRQAVPVHRYLSDSSSRK